MVRSKTRKEPLYKMGANARGVSRESHSQNFRYIGYLETGSAISMFNTTTL